MEALTTAGIISLCVITGCKLAITIFTRIKRSKCVSKNHEMDVKFASDSTTEKDSEERPRRRKHTHHSKHRSHKTSR